MGKVAIVGVEGSGKTVLMAGLCECFKQVPGSDDPYLMPENQAAFKFMETVPCMLRVKRQWPAATSIDNLRAMRWTYRCGDEVLETVELLDYPGELYRLAFGDAEEIRKEDLESKRDEVKKFLDHLIDADTLLVLLNLSDIVNLGENHKNLETVWITRGILSYAKKLKNVKHTVLVFTQADRYAQELKVAGGPVGLYAKKLPMLKTIFPNQEVMSVAAVSGTDGRGLPLDGYSTTGCQEIMRCILAETEKDIVQSLSLCEASLEQIERFNSGSPKEFSSLVECFSTHVDRLIEVAKPLRKFYSGQIKGFERDASRLSVLARDLKQFVENRDILLLAKPETWTGLEKNYADVDLLFVHFRRYFQEKNKKQNEEKKKEKKAMFIGLSLVGVVIALLIGFSIKDSRDKKARQRQVEQEHLEAEQARKVKLSIGLAAALEAKEFGKWQSCLDRANEVLILEPKNTEASALRAEAEQNLIPKLTFKVEAGGREVAATISEGLSSYSALHTFMLKPHYQYTFKVSLNSSQGVRYKTETLAVNVDWCGPKTRRVVMEALPGPVEGENWISPNTGMEFVWIPPLKIWVGRYEVKNGEYRKKESTHDSKDYKGHSLNGENQPVVYVNFQEALAYAAWMTELDNKQLGGLRYRLPSLKEWQAVAQCGDGREYPWGNSMPPKFGNYKGQEIKGLESGMLGDYTDGYIVTCPVEKSGRNDWGIYGIGGNVEERCASDSSGKWNGAECGASWFCYPAFTMRCEYRDGYAGGSPRSCTIGFRLVVSP